MSATLTITVPEETLARLQRKAEAHGTTPEAVAAAELSRPPRKSDSDPLMKLAGMFRSGVPDAADRHDDYLGQALHDEMQGEEEKPDVR